MKKNELLGIFLILLVVGVFTLVFNTNKEYENNNLIEEPLTDSEEVSLGDTSSNPQLITPYYNKPPQKGLVSHFSAVAESTDLPVVLYNVPGRTGCNLLPETVAELAEISNICGIKTWELKKIIIG